MKSMIVMLSCLLILLGVQQIQAQQYLCGESAGQLYEVIPHSGLTLRAAPSLSANKILAVPHGKTVSVCHDEQLHHETIDGHTGQWVRAFYRGESGYMFDAFLKAHAPIEVIHLDSYSTEQLPTDKHYLGLYADHENQFAPHFRIDSCHFSYDTTTIEDGDQFVSARIEQEEQPVFLFSGIPVHQKHSLPGQQFASKFLFPGESVHLSTDKASFYIYAKGNVQLNKGTHDPSPFSMIKNYELRVRRISGDEVEDKVIYKMDIPAWYGEGYEGGIHLQWIGDIDGDGELDMLLTTSNHYACWEVNFFLSSKAERGHFFRQVSRYQDCGC